jgi:hypothetical protein
MYFLNILLISYDILSEIEGHHHDMPMQCQGYKWVGTLSVYQTT